MIRDADTKKSTHDFGHDIIPYLIDRYRVYAHRFEKSCVGMSDGGEAYWRDVGTIDAYWEANMEMVSVVPALDLYDKSWPIWTYQEQLPPAKFVFNDEDRRGVAIDSMVSGGCIISGARVHHSLLFSDIRVGSRSEINDSVILSGARIGEDVKLNRVVLDNNCEIPGRNADRFRSRGGCASFPCFSRRHYAGDAGYAGAVDPPYSMRFV